MREHWTKRNRRKKSQQSQIRYELKDGIDDVKLPVLITLTRISPRQLDSDNLVASFKHVRDCVADLITPGLRPGMADDVEGLTFAYAQEKGKTYAIRITIEESH